MTKAYQYTADGYYAGDIEDYGLLPNNATYIAPRMQDGHIPRWTCEGWELVEDHKGAEGYVNGQLHTVKEYGPLPEGWSDTPPPPTTDDLAAAVRGERDRRIGATDYLMMPDYPLEGGARDRVLTYRQALRDMPEQPGFPWNSVEDVPWPEVPTYLTL